MTSTKVLRSRTWCIYMVWRRLCTSRIARSRLHRNLGSRTSPLPHQVLQAYYRMCM